MKFLKRIFAAILLVIYVPISLFVTICLLNFNEYNVTEFGKNTLLVIDDDLEHFKRGDLAVVYKNSNNDINANDYIFFYESTSSSVIISYAKVHERVDISREKSNYIIDGGYEVSSDFVIGKHSTTKNYANLGSVLSLLESRWGFVIFIIFPLLLMFVYEIYSLVLEIKIKDEDEDIKLTTK